MSYESDRRRCTIPPDQYCVHPNVCCADCGQTTCVNRCGNSPERCGKALAPSNAPPREREITRADLEAWMQHLIRGGELSDSILQRL